VRSVGIINILSDELRGLESLFSSSGNSGVNSLDGNGVSVEFPNVSSPSVSPFDPTELNHSLHTVSIDHGNQGDLSHTSHEFLSESSSQHPHHHLSLNTSNHTSSGEDSPMESPSSPQQNGTLMIPSIIGEESVPGEDDQNGRGGSNSPLPTSKPIPIPGASSSSTSTPSYSSIVRASSTSPLLTSSSAPGTFKKATTLSTSAPSASKKEDVKSILPVAALNDKKGRKVCSFFLQGICRYGQQCRHRHLHCVSDKCLSCGQTVGSTPEEQQLHLTMCTEVVAMEKERRESASKKCGICHQLTLKLNRKFGLLISCNHSFCLQCIREWRGSSEHSRERVRACPICKVVSHYVIPCDRHVAEPTRKQRVIVEYKWRLGQIDCKHYNRGKAVCPFGEACFYRHEDGSAKKTTRRTTGPKTYNENIFDPEEEDDDDVAELDDDEEDDIYQQDTLPPPPLPRERAHLKFAKKKNLSSSTATTSGTSSSTGTSSISMLKKNNNKITTTTVTPSSTETSKLSNKKNINSKYAKSKPKNVNKK